MGRVLGIVALALVVLASDARGDVITVTTTVDEFGTGAGCSLREAVKAANDDAAFGGCPAGSGVDQITIPAGTYTLAIAGAAEDDDATGDLDVLQSVSITGAGAASTIVDGGGLDRVFDVAFGATVSISDLTVQGGAATGDAGGGVLSNGMLTLSNLVVTGNAADGGGGLALNGPSSTVSDCTVSGNTATTAGGGLEVQGGGSATVVTSTVSGNSAPYGGGVFNLDTLVLRNSTISGNTGSTQGGGIYNNSGTLALHNVTIAANSAPSGDVAGLFNNDVSGTTTSQNSLLGDNVSATPAHADCGGTLTSAGHNLVETIGACTITGDTTGNVTGQDPVLGPLGDNGGTTATHTLLAGSPALNAGDPGVPGSGGTTCEADDQIGTTRPVGAACDIGAVEAAIGGATTTTSTSTTVTTTTSTSTTSTTSTSSTTSTTTTSTTTSTTSTTSSSITTTSNTSTTVTTTTSTSTSTTSSTSTSSSSTTSSTSSTSSSTTTTSSSTTSTTLAPVCVGGTTISKGSIVIAKLGAPTGNERITFKGVLDFPLGQPATVDPASTGAQVLIEDLATGGAVGVLDLTHLTTPIPPGAPGTGCGAKDGWTKKGYRNLSGALAPPTCPAGSAHGLTNMVLADQRSKGKGVRFAVKTRKSTLTAAGPLRATIVLGATETDSLAGRCGVVTFSPSSCKLRGATLTCR